MGSWGGQAGAEDLFSKTLAGPHLPAQVPGDAFHLPGPTGLLALDSYSDATTKAPWLTVTWAGRLGAATDHDPLLPPCAEAPGTHLFLEGEGHTGPACQ